MSLLVLMASLCCLTSTQPVFTDQQATSPTSPASTEASPSHLSTSHPEDTPLLALANAVHALSTAPTPYNDSDVRYLHSLLERVVAIDTDVLSARPELTAGIVQDTEAFLRCPFNFQGSVHGNVSLVFTNKDTGGLYGNLHNFGEFYAEDGFEVVVEEDDLVLNIRYYSFWLVIYPVGRYPRAMIETPFPLTYSRVVQVVNSKMDPSLEDDDYWKTMVIEMSFPPGEPCLGCRRGCARWSDSSSQWLRAGRFNTRDYDTTRCHVNMDLFTEPLGQPGNAPGGLYAIYEYVEDIAQHVAFSDTARPAENVTTNATELARYAQLIHALAATPQNASCVDALLTDLLPKALAAAAAATAAATPAFDADPLLADVGAILSSVDPSNLSGLLGRGTPSMAGFVVAVDDYQHEPLVGFAFFRPPALWMDATRRGDIAVDALFNEDTAFVILFSEAVTRLNARYGFVLYPQDSFFRPPPKLESTIFASRVVDVVLVPRDGDDGVGGDQTVTVSFLPVAPSQDTKMGCRVWSAALRDWADAGCAMDALTGSTYCRCSLNESSARAQIIVFLYSDVDFRQSYMTSTEDTFGSDWLDIPVDIDLLRSLKAIPRTDRTLEMLLEAVVSFLFDIDLRMLALRPDVVATFLTETRKAMTNTHLTFADFFDITSSGNVIEHFSGCISVSHYRDGDLSFVQTIYDCSADLVTASTVFSLRSNAASLAGSRSSGFLLFKPDIKMLPPPPTGSHDYHSQMLDIVLVPGNASAGVERRTTPSVEVFFAPAPHETRQACAVWSEAGAAWATDACAMITVPGGWQVCNCSLAPTGGLVLAFAYSDVTLDEATFHRVVGSSSTADDAEDTLLKAADLVSNCSRLPPGADTLVMLTQIYNAVLNLPSAVLASRRRVVQTLLADLDVAVNGNRRGELTKQCEAFGVQGAQVVKSTGLDDDLYSNAVLFGNESTGDIAVASHMSVVVISIDHWRDAQAVGFWFARGKAEEPRFMMTEDRPTDFNATSLVLKSHFAVVSTSSRLDILFIFTVSPINKIIFPNTMTSRSTFNMRQLDVYLKDDYEKYKFELFWLDIYFEPSLETKDYVKKACASWDDAGQTWSTERCVQSPRPPDNIEYCHCNMTYTGGLRVVVYEYTDRENFAFKTSFEPHAVIYMVGASLSAAGLAGVAATAALFSKWRDELGNKILMHLTAATFLYVVVAMFRESHVIFADTNHDDVALIVFTVVVHYTRLAHCCWGLAMSVLQYRRFSSLVGATDTPHLLLKVSLLAWGVPLAPLIILLGWNQKTHFCSADKLTHYVVYLVPGAIITALTLALLAKILYIITDKCGRGGDKDLKRHGVSNIDLLKRRAMTVTMLFFLFGVPTVFEMFNDLGSHSEVVEYLYKMTDSIQGFVLFVFFVVLDDRAKGMWASWWEGVRCPKPACVVAREARKVEIAKVARKVELAKVSTKARGVEKGKRSKKDKKVTEESIELEHNSGDLPQ